MTGTNKKEQDFGKYAYQCAGTGASKLPAYQIMYAGLEHNVMHDTQRSLTEVEASDTAAV